MTPFLHPPWPQQEIPHADSHLLVHQNKAPSEGGESHSQLPSFRGKEALSQGGGDTLLLSELCIAHSWTTL